MDLWLTHTQGERKSWRERESEEEEEEEEGDECKSFKGPAATLCKRGHV